MTSSTRGDALNPSGSGSVTPSPVGAPTTPGGGTPSPVGAPTTPGGGTPSPVGAPTTPGGGTRPPVDAHTTPGSGVSTPMPVDAAGDFDSAEADNNQICAYVISRHVISGAKTVCRDHIFTKALDAVAIDAYTPIDKLILSFSHHLGHDRCNFTYHAARGGKVNVVCTTCYLNVSKGHDKFAMKCCRSKNELSKLWRNMKNHKCLESRSYVDYAARTVLKVLASPFNRCRGVDHDSLRTELGERCVGSEL